MHDVARAAGVSHQTVSRVLNDRPTVRPETRTRVLTAIEELGYRRNTAARALVTRRSATIGVIIDRSTLFGPTSALLGVEAAAREAGYFVSLVSLTEPTVTQTKAAPEHFLDQGVEGLVVIATSAAMVGAAAAVALRIPAVTIASSLDPRSGESLTSVDQSLGGRLATRHLIQLGHRRIAHLSGPADSLDAIARRVGWEGELAAAGIEPQQLILGDWSAGIGYQAGQRLAAHLELTAIFAGNDEMALGLLLALAEAGIDVPRDVSVVGFDDAPGAAFYSPPLTTVRQDFGGLGLICMKMLTSVMNGATYPGDPQLPPELIVRDSTGVPAVR